MAGELDGGEDWSEVIRTMELGDPFRKDALRLPTRHLPQFADYT